MPAVHFLNVGNGDCIVIQHGSGRVSMIDICSGNIDAPSNAFAQGGLAGIGLRPPPNASAEGALAGLGLRGNLGMGTKPTRPQDFLRELGVSEIWRFILTHPDMDHLDGFDALFNEFTVHNFWHSGASREKPSFGGFSRYKEMDWDRYERVKTGRDKVNSRLVLAGDRFAYANQNDTGHGWGDGLNILAPTPELIYQANQTEDPNDGSYVILYCSESFRIIFAGDSHDETWEQILTHHAEDVANCDVLIAPHHGRDSGRQWDFLDVLRPKLTLFGVARSEHLAYEAWNKRGLFKITNNQAGNISIEVSEQRLDVFVENENFAIAKSPRDILRHPLLGYRRYGYVRSSKLTTDRFQPKPVT
jgi:competence protein ComEC